MKWMGIKYACSGCGETFESKEKAIACCQEEAYLVSECCEEEIGHKVKTEYPLGGRVWGIDYEVPCCMKCGSEIDDTLEGVK
jgi:DNA-directed RNA polymerase subunit RPC12/RpoP